MGFVRARQRSKFAFCIVAEYARAALSCTHVMPVHALGYDGRASTYPRPKRHVEGIKQNTIRESKNFYTDLTRDYLQQ